MYANVSSEEAEKYLANCSKQTILENAMKEFDEILSLETLDDKLLN